MKKYIPLYLLISIINFLYAILIHPHYILSSGIDKKRCKFKLVKLINKKKCP